MNKKVVRTLLTAAMAFSLTAAAATGVMADEADYSDVSIAYLTPSLDVPFWTYVKFGVEDQVAQTMPGATVTVYDSKDNANTQLSNAQDAITKGVSAIVISPTDSASCVAVLSEAEDAGVPVVICDIGTDSGNYLAFVATDNFAGAQELGEYVAEKLNEGDQFAQITLNQARINGVRRKEGFEAGVESKGLEEVDFRQMEKVNREEGHNFTQDLVTAYPDLKLVFCHSEDPTMGAVAALEEVGNEDVQVVGFDCSPEVVDAIKDGKVLATAAQQPVLMGRVSVDQIKANIDGEEVEQEVTLGTFLVTADNIDEKYDELLAVALTAE